MVNDDNMMTYSLFNSAVIQIDSKVLAFLSLYAFVFRISLRCTLCFHMLQPSLR